MIDKDTFSQQLNQLPIEEADSFSLFSELQTTFPASPIVNFYYLKLLQIHNPEQYENVKGQLLLTLLNRDIYHQFDLYPYQKRADNLSPENSEEFAKQTLLTTPNEKITGVIVSELEKEKTIDYLIDKFSKDPPKIQADPTLHDVTANYGEQSLSEDDEIVTETLAELYANQGYYGKAVKMYKKLLLIFPKKSAYFADRILQVNQMQKEGKKK